MKDKNLSHFDTPSRQSVDRHFEPPESNAREPENFDQDLVLLAAVRLGDESAVAALYDRHSSLVYAIALRILRDPEEAQDVLQEVFLQVWRDSTNFIGTRGTFRAWLAVVARNRSIDSLRRRRPSESIDALSLSSPANIFRDVEHNLLSIRLRVLVAALPMKQRNAIRLAFFEQMTHAEIAKKTGCPLGTVKSTIRSGVQSLHRSFAVA